MNKIEISNHSNDGVRILEENTVISILDILVFIFLVPNYMIN